MYFRHSAIVIFRFATAQARRTHDATSTSHRYTEFAPVAASRFRSGLVARWSMESEKSPLLSHGLAFTTKMALPRYPPPAGVPTPRAVSGIARHRTVLMITAP